MAARRGGIQQRMVLAAKPSVKSELCSWLLNEWSWGRMSLPQVQRIAQFAHDDMKKAYDGVQFEDLKFLAHIGTQGRFANNMHRDVMSKLNKIRDLPPLTKADLPTKKGDSTASMCLPHEIFAWLYEHNREKFHKQFMPGGESHLVQFWDKAKHNPAMKSEILGSLNPRRCIPVGCHGDEVPISGRGKCWCQLALVVSWFSLLCPMLPTKESLLLIWTGNPGQFVQGVNGTMDCFWKIVAWSLGILATGCWPHSDWRGVRYATGSQDHRKAGSQIAGGYYAILLSVCGDLDYLAKFVGLAHWASANKPCSLCGCTKSGIKSYKDFRTNAGWRTTLVGPNDNVPSSCALFTVSGVSSCTVRADLMHVKYLGFMQYFLGSVLWILTHTLMPASPEANISRIGVLIAKAQRRWLTTHRYPAKAFQRLSIFLRKTGFPKLRGKASQVKGLVPALQKIWKKFADRGNIRHRRIALIFDLDIQIEDLLSAHDPSAGFFAVPASIGREIVQKQIQMSQLYVQLEEAYAEEPKPLFNVVSKLHYCLHIMEEAASIHPFLNWCWKGEDFMQITSTLVSSALRGRGDVSASIKALEKYRYAMYVLWTKST